ncbi:MAG: hypothetical protein KBT11_07675, partial [Treponema sp.]|nr:hypothetical protein [Candidatus Treponema equifaecale]
VLLAVFLFSLSVGFAQELHPDPWSLIIYRPENSQGMNDVRCWLKLEDAKTGEDVTYTNAKARYEWVANTKNIEKKDPRSLAAIFVPSKTTVLYNYRKTYFLSGGMAMHLNIKPGKYRISVQTPKDKTNGFPCKNNGDWNSNIFEYDTKNPAKVIFVSPTSNDNGFYNGGWHINYKAPGFYKFTKPLPTER